MPKPVVPSPESKQAAASQKRLQKSLLKIGALEKAILTSANFAIIATDEKGVIQLFNTGAESMLGYRAKEVLNKISPSDISDPQEVITRATTLSTELATTIKPGFEALVFKASRGIEDIYELTYIRKDGSRFPALLSVTALHDEKEVIIGYLLIGTDNTERKAIEAECAQLLKNQEAINKQLQQANYISRENEEKLAVTLHSIGDGVIATDASARVTLLNPMAEKLTGWTLADARGKQVEEIFKIINNKTRQPAKVPVADTLAKGTVQGLDNHILLVANDGSECDIADSCAPIRDRDGVVIGAVLVFRDVTGEYATVRALRDSNELIQTVLNTVGDGIITLFAKDGVVVTVNPAAEHMFAYRADELIGKKFSMLVPELDQEACNDSLAYYSPNEAERAAGFGHKVMGRCKNGKLFPMEMAVSEMWLGEQRYFTGILRDDTARTTVEAERTQLYLSLKEKHAELDSARQVAEKANLAKSEFLSSMSHELRTPLNAILGFAQLLESGIPAPSDTQLLRLQQIIKAGWYLLDLINEILDLAVIESGRVALSRESVLLSEVMQECQAMIEPQALERDIQLSFIPFDATWHANADRTRVKQVLINLLTNAIKYNRERGSIIVECSEPVPGRIRISIKDSGKGLTPEKIQNLFQPFNRLGQETGPEEGTGIGLVVTRQLVELMGGKIGVESQVGAGSEFWFELNRDVTPSIFERNNQPTDRLPEVQDNAARRCLLYVEDNPANLLLVEQIIANFGNIHMLSADDGPRGIALARTLQPDVILMDINLPGINGFEVLEILQQDPLTVNIPVLAISANALPRDIKKGLDAGFMGYLTKPIKLDEFMATLNLALNITVNKSLQNIKTKTDSETKPDTE